MKINESGRSMIEMLGVLAIIGVLSVGGIAGYSKAMSKYRVNKTVDQISHIAANTRILFGSQTSYAGLDSETADGRAIINKSNLVPLEMATYTEGAITGYHDPFQGKVTITASKRFNNDSQPKAFVLEYEGIPDEACIELATLDWGTGSGGGLVALSVNTEINNVTVNGGTGEGATTACTGGNGVLCGGDGVMDVATATSKCDQGDNNILRFKFY